MDELRGARRPNGGEEDWFSDFTRLPTVLPLRAWAALRLVSVSVCLGLLLLLWRHPALGLKLFWGVAVPLLPLVFWLLQNHLGYAMICVTLVILTFSRTERRELMLSDD